MAVITFYEATQIDMFQLTDGLRQTDHYWEFRPDAVNVNSLNLDAEVVSISTASNLTREIMDRLPRLKLIAVRSTGFDNIDLDYAIERNITVVNVPTYGENTVAEYAFALLLAVNRKLIQTVSATKDGNFVASQHTGADLKGKTIGIIGMGHIGRHMAKIASGFSMNVIAYDIHTDDKLAEELSFTYKRLNEVIGESDILSLHAPLTPNNYHMINHHSIEKMKPGAILINTARGELVENRALITALKSKLLAGAGLDTIEGEHFLSTNSLIDAITDNATAPLVYEYATEDRVLLQMPNVVVTQHAAFNTSEAIRRINDTTCQNIIKFWYGDSPNKVHAIQSSGQLVVIRHGESEWNALGKWTGVTDVHLTKKGFDHSAELGRALADIDFNYAYSSQQMRARETLELIMNGSGQIGLAHESARALNERDYGVYTGMNKDQIKEMIGDEKFDELRRSWDSPVEGGESLEQVYQRVVPFYLRVILPRLRHGQNVLVVAHGNSIRSLVKYIENISNDAIGDMNMIQDEALIYEVDSEGRSKEKSILSTESTDNPQ
ncbi:2,3-bisphosphoglycerate-dependent phosphoglycerate mutase [Candidatus Nomurabacteria bacterium]|nr:2,3-bisphosphoglycerate-dependent phosphoglycerate mutase [Candidatus Nomurabacteria bacterium]